MAIAEFDKSPLTEVVCGVEFDAPDFASVHFGMYWQAIQERFPSEPLDRPPLGVTEIAPLPPLRRVWFESLEQRELIQLQANRFHYNWRRLDETDQYPRFEKIYPTFSREWQGFQNWWISIGKLPAQPLRYELTYLNQIDENVAWNGAGDNYRFFTFSGKDWKNFLGQPEVHNFNLEFVIPDDLGILKVSANHLVSVEDGKPAILLELTARSRDTNLDIEQWFRCSHTFLVKAFIDLIQDEVKKEWGFRWFE